jgi:hypothetical protein
MARKVAREAGWQDKLQAICEVSWMARQVASKLGGKLEDKANEKKLFNFRE